MLPVLTQLFLYAFGLDAILSFWSEIYHIDAGPVAEIRTLIALSTLMQGVVLYACIGFTRRVSFRLVGWPTLFLLWANLTACFPLPLFYLPSAGIWAASVQLLLAGVLVGAYWRSQALPTGSGFSDPALLREGFGWKRFLIFFGANLIFLPLLLTSSLLGSTVQGIEKATGGYVRLRPSGLYVTQSKFRKNSQEVALDGMMHVADGGFYEKIRWGVAGMRTLVLLEGVSDRDELLKGGLGMDRLAKVFGLGSQMNEGVYRKTLDALAKKQESGEVDSDGNVEVEKSVDVRSADVDVNTFHPATIKYLKAVAGLFQANGLEEVIKILQEKNSPLQDEKIAREAMDDILKGRNTFLIGEIEKGLHTHDRVVVPWGAMHLAGIEQDLRAKGFVEISRVEKAAVLFWH